MNLFIVAGEASADVHAAALVQALKREAPDSHFFGAGGKSLREQGVEVVVDAKSLSVVGISDWFDKLGEVWASYRTLVGLIETREFDAAILCDLPDLNLLLAKKLKRKKIPVIYYISPQIWAWRAYRISKIKRLVDLMLVILPFEREFYEKRGVPAEFVGHPLLDIINAKMSYRSQAEILAGPRIAVLPGSRRSEIKYHAPILGEVTRRIKSEYPNASFQVPLASTLSNEFVAEQIPNLRESLKTRTQDVLHWCDLALVASGTATLETALTGTPFCLFYRVSRSSIWIFNTFVRYRGFIGIPNLLLEREVVREFLQQRLTADSLFDEAKKLIVDPNYRDKMVSGLEQCRRKLGTQGASHRAAAHILKRCQAPFDHETAHGKNVPGTFLSFCNFFWILLLPLCCAWAIVTKLRRRYYPISWQYRAKFPVICVGNIHSGGSGKTPLVIEIADRFHSPGLTILSRGYLGTLSRKGSRVEPLTLFGDKLFGDEPWMMAHRVQCPVFIGQDRVRITKQLEQEGMTSLLILDDGFQHLSLARTVDIVAINTQKSIEEFCLPLGDLREPFSSLRNKRSAIAIVLTRGDENERVGIWKEFLREWVAELPVFESVRENMGLWYGNEPIGNMGRKMGCFCGIAEPAGFLRETHALGASVCLKTFPDHHPYTQQDLEWILAEKQRLGADLMVTTDKDWFKVYPWFEKRGEKVYSLRIRSKLPDDFWSFLERRIA